MTAAAEDPGANSIAHAFLSAKRFPNRRARWAQCRCRAAPSAALSTAGRERREPPPVPADRVSPAPPRPQQRHIPSVPGPPPGPKGHLQCRELRPGPLDRPARRPAVQGRVRRALQQGGRDGVLPQPGLVPGAPRRARGSALRVHFFLRSYPGQHQCSNRRFDAGDGWDVRGHGGPGQPRPLRARVQQRCHLQGSQVARRGALHGRSRPLQIGSRKLLRSVARCCALAPFRRAAFPCTCWTCWCTLRVTPVYLSEPAQIGAGGSRPARTALHLRVVAEGGDSVRPTQRRRGGAAGAQRRRRWRRRRGLLRAGDWHGC